MKIECLNGFYYFYPESVGELFNWEELNEELTSIGDAYTFPKLASFPEYVWAGHIVNGLPMIMNYAGKREEIFRRNNLTYNIALGTVTSSLGVWGLLDCGEGLFISSDELPQAYYLDKNQRRISGFLAFWDMVHNMYKIEQFYYSSGVLGGLF